MQRAFHIVILAGVLAMAALWVFVVGGREKHTIRYMIWDDNRGTIRAICEEWNQAHPDQTVQLIVSPWDGYWDKLFAMMVAGDAPDVFWLTPVYRVTYISKGQLLDLSPYVERSGFSLDDFQPRQLVMDWVVDGKVYGINRDFDTIGLFYNRKLFGEAGISYPDDTWDWDRLLEVALQFKDYFERTEQPDKWPLDIPTWEQGGWLNLVWQNGGRMLSPDGKRFALDEPAAVEALQWQADLIFKHHVCPVSGAGAVGGIELFTAGKLAMTYHGSWTVRQVAATQGLDWDVAVLPKGKERAVVTNGLAECVWRHTPNPDVCWEFVEYITSDACQKRLPVIASRKTATRSWLQSNVYEREVDGVVQEVMVPGNGHVFIDMLEYARARQITPDLLEWSDVLEKYTQALLIAGEMDARDAMARAAAEVNPILQRATDG